MTRELITTWADYQMALDRLLALATRQVMIYDEDLKQLSLDGARLAHLQRRLRLRDPTGRSLAFWWWTTIRPTAWCCGS